MDSDHYAVKGDIVYSVSPAKVCSLKGGFIDVKDGLVTRIHTQAPDQVQIVDCSDKLVIPAFTDLHTHAAQFANVGRGYDEPLLSWLAKITLPEEAKFSDPGYATSVYRRFVYSLWQNGILHSVVMPTLHLQSTKLLIDLMHKAGLYCHVGKVNMDIALGDTLHENSVADSIADTKELIQYCEHFAPLISYTVTPRFVLSCSSELLQSLGDLSVERALPVHTHLSENRQEIKNVRELYPDCTNYASVYEKFRLLGGQRTVMAHCIYSDKQPGEMDLLRNGKTWIAHCPTSNSNLTSGIAPVSLFLQKGMQVGLGSDISGGHTLNMFEVMRHAIQCSKIRSLDSEIGEKPLSAQEVFYLATMGGGSFFGKTGSFLPGYKFNALILKKDGHADEEPMARLERLIYAGDHNVIETRIRDGRVLHAPE